MLNKAMPDISKAFLISLNPRSFIQCVNRSPDLASSYSGVFPSYDSDFMPFRPLHGYWDSPEISSEFPRHPLDAGTSGADTHVIHFA